MMKEISGTNFSRNTSAELTLQKNMIIYYLLVLPLPNLIRMRGSLEGEGIESLRTQ